MLCLGLMHLVGWVVATHSSGTWGARGRECRGPASMAEQQQWWVRRAEA